MSEAFTVGALLCFCLDVPQSFCALRACIFELAYRCPNGPGLPGGPKHGTNLARHEHGRPRAHAGPARTSCHAWAVGEARRAGPGTARFFFIVISEQKYLY